MRYRHVLALPIALALLSTVCPAQGRRPESSDPTVRTIVLPDPGADFLGPYGLHNFSDHHVDALRTFLLVEEDYAAGRYVAARARLAALWNAHPTGGLPWGALPTQPFGINIGSPPCYYGLRMLTDMVDWRLASGVTGDSAPRTVRLTVMLVGETSGIEPRDEVELAQGQGVPVVHTLDPDIEANGSAVVHQSLQLFRDYVLAATEGNLAVETHVLPLPQVSLPVHAALLPGGGRFAGLTDAWQVFAHVPEVEREATDWWWVLYPSHVPEQYPDFTTAEFITGGMGTGPDSVSPFFIIDDRWLLRKPPHIGSGPYSEVERRAYLPQWLQHEFFHHLFRTWPSFGLEATSHQWFDRSTWPPDFVGRYEADYYHEALVKRLQTATPPPHVALRYATADAPWDQLVLGDVLGTYERHPIRNPWHVGTITQVSGNTLRWTNTAGVSWNLQADLLEGALLTGPDCPYFGLPNAQQFSLLLERDALGDLTAVIDAFAFLGERYEKAP